MALSDRAPASVAHSDGFDVGFRGRVERARDHAAAALRRERDPTGGWTGGLSASALSTATAVTALTIVARGDPRAAEGLRDFIRRGCVWLVQHQNSDGGWGDTTRSLSNISTTTLAWAALGLCRDVDVDATRSIVAAERWLHRAAGSLEPKRLVRAIEDRYGKDRTFSIPILTMCALCGRLGAGRDGWSLVRQLPFELAALPQKWFGALQLPVVSYALPALIAIGQVCHGRRPTRNPLWRILRDRCRAPTLDKLLQLQPANGGFLEAAPLTSFVTMSLAALGLGAHPIVQRGVSFLLASARKDGSWPIDTNLSTWLTTLSVNALVPDGRGSYLPEEERQAIRAWLMAQQFRREHPYTLAAPGGWAWTNLPGGVPDADDTAGAILALHRCAPDDPKMNDALEAAVIWLLELQNRDGGIPTFCRGWGRLPFDRSSPDITAHVIRGWIIARRNLPAALQRRVDSAVARAAEFLSKSQRSDGAWIPLWFGHQDDSADENPLYGTARVVSALAALEVSGMRALRGEVLDRALQWIVARQKSDGGWAGADRAASSMEETGLALEALTAGWERANLAAEERDALQSAMMRGGAWLCQAIENEQWHAPVPIGFYFAKLWYYERLYPLIFATGALTRLANLR